MNKFKIYGYQYINVYYTSIVLLVGYLFYYFYNIIKKVSIPNDLNPEIFYEVTVTANMPWTTFSHQVYGNQNLWWLICLANNIQNPIDNPTPGKEYTVIKPTFVSRILSEINKQTY